MTFKPCLCAPGPMLEDAGCYVDDENNSVYLFSGDGTLVVVTGNQAFTQALVIHTHKKVPPEWKSDQVLERSYALFYEAHIQRGKYIMNADGQVCVWMHVIASPDESVAIFFSCTSLHMHTHTTTTTTTTTRGW